MSSVHVEQGFPSCVVVSEGSRAQTAQLGGFNPLLISCNSIRIWKRIAPCISRTSFGRNLRLVETDQLIGSPVRFMDVYVCMIDHSGSRVKGMLWHSRLSVACQLNIGQRLHKVDCRVDITALTKIKRKFLYFLEFLMTGKNKSKELQCPRL